MVPGSHRMVFNTGEPAYAVDPHGTIVAWNPAASRTFGFPVKKALGCKCWELLQGRDAFDNDYCGESCPIRRMALSHRSVNRCRMSFRTAAGAHQAYTVTMLALFHDGEAILVHLCRGLEAGPREQAATAGEMPGAGRGVLTTRERAVVRHLSDGRTTREIATLLSISVSTVRSHIEHILRKLDAHSRLEAVAIARRLGLD